MVKCKYPECKEEAEYMTDSRIEVCHKHYNMYKFIMDEVNFILKVRNIK